MELRLLGVSATVDPAHPVVPKNIPSAVRIVVRAGATEMSLADALRFLGPLATVKGELSGPGLSQTVTLPIRAPEDPVPADPFILPLPGLTVTGDYTLANLRIESGGRPVLDVTPSTVTVQVIEQVLVTSVKTRALTLDEIREKGIVLDSDDYLGFEFNLGLKLESQPVNFTFPVVFDRQGVRVPDALTPPPAPPRQGVPLPTLVPLLLEPESPPDTGDSGGGGPHPPIVLPTGEPVRIPAVLVIPGNVGYLKQFFSAQLFVANGAPVGSGLTLRDVSGKVHLPPGADLEPGTDDDPLALPDTVRGPQPDTLPVVGPGPDGKLGTPDDDERFSPGEQGEAEFLIRGEREGFHTLDFDIAATLEGLVSGPVAIKGKASGGVLVRNPFFDMTFTVPATVRQGETFKLFASVTNIGQGIANDVTVSLDAAAISGCRLLSDASVHLATLAPGDSKTVAFEFSSQRTGQVVASYLKLEGPGQSGGNLRFSLGVGERGVPLSPDTLVLPAAVDAVPADVVDAAMRVLGQAWSVANAPSGTLPRGVLRTSKAVVTAKALALAEAGLRIGLGQDVRDALAALDYDFFAGSPTDPGFDQILRETQAGQDLREVFGGTAPTEEPTSPGGPRLSAAAVIGPEVLAGAGPFGLHAILVFDRILDSTSAADITRYQIPANTVRSAKAVLSGRLVVMSLERPEGPYVATTISVSGLQDRAGRRGSGSVELGARLADPGAVVSGRVITADGSPVNGATVVYTNNTDPTCQRPALNGLAQQQVGGDGRFEYRYVRRDSCGTPFEMVTSDPATAAQRKSTGFVRAAGERIVLDIVLLGRGAVEGTIRDLQARPVAGASVVVRSETDPQSGGQGTTDAAGRYRIDGITVGPVSVKAAKGIVVGHSSGRLDRAGTTATVDVILDGGSVRVSGKVRRIEGGVETAVPGVYVLYQIDPAPRTTTVGYVRTGADGRFQFADMPAGVTQLQTQLATGETTTSPSFTTAPGDDLTGKDLVFDIAPPAQTGAVQGVVLLPDGSPAGLAIVTVGTRGVRAGTDGSFRIDGVQVQPNQPQRVDAQSADGRRTGYSTFLLNTAGAVAPAVIRLSGIGAARFTVLDPAGLPIPGLEVAVRKACSNPCGCDSRTTDANGQVSWDGVGVGQFQVQAIREVGGAYEAAEAIASVVRDGETAFAVVRFQGLGSVSGLVLDPTTPEGRPSFGATVSLSSRHFVYDPAQFICGMVEGPSHQARSGTDGRVHFTGVGIGNVTLSATQDFFPNPVAVSGQLTSNGQDLPLTVRLVNTTAGVLSGLVTLPDGITPAGRGVQVTARGALPDVVVETNDQGRYHFARIFPQGSYRLTVSDPATGGLAQTQVFLQAGQDLVTDVRLKGRGTVRVTVVDGLNVPLDNAYVRLQETEFPGRLYEGALGPATQGVVEFEGVYEGPFAVEASDVFARGGRTSARVPRDGETVDVKVRVSATGTVAGRFLKADAATPIPNGVVKLVVSGRTLGQVTTASAGDIGHFEFAYVPAGPVRLEAEDPLTGRTGIAAGTIETEGQVLALNVLAQALGRVQGAVTSNGVLQPLAFVDVTSGSFKASTQTGADGRYLFDGVPEGQVTASASLADGFLKGTNTGSLQGEGGSVDVDVALRSSGRLVGQVLAADGVTAGPLSQIHVWAGGTGGGSLSAVTDADGRFLFERVPAGQAFVQADVVSSIDGATATVVVPEAGEASVSLRLNGLGTVQGTTLDSAGLPTGGLVSISGPKGGLAITVGAEGHFEVRDLLAGPYTASLRVDNAGISLFGTASVEVLPGQVAQVSLQLQPSGLVTGQIRRADGTTPAYGAEVTLRMSATGAQLVAQAQADGRFTFRGVPLGAFTLAARDSITGGLAVLSGRSVVTNGETVDVGILVLDATAPTLAPVEPVPGSTRAALAGPLVIDVADQGTGVDPASLVMIAPGGVAAVPFTFVGGRATSSLRADLLVVGENRLVAQIKDRAGNVSTTEWRFTATGGALRGSVLRADGSVAAGAPLQLNGVAKPSADATGHFSFTGLPPGPRTVTATDPETGLPASVTVALGDGEDRTLTEPLRLPAFGRITGSVRHPDGSPAAGVIVTVSGTTRVSAPDGSFDLGAFPLGSYGLTATGPDGDRGEGTATLTTLGSSVFVPITLNGLGVVRVVLRDAAGALVGGASVTVSSSSPFAGLLTRTTNADGSAAVFTGVLAGTITARATHPSTGLVGETTGLLTPGAVLDLTASLQPSGRIEGTVFHRQGDIAPGVEVRLTAPRSATTTTGSDGRFSFENVPLGSWSLNVLEVATGDVGQASGTLATAGTTANGDVTLNGVGTVRVTVRDAGGALVAGAAVSVATSGGAGKTGITDGAGVATIANVLAGIVTANATHPSNGTHGTASGSLAATATLDLAVTLEATGTIRGRVLAPDGVTPVAGAAISGIASGTITGPTGEFEFPDVRVGTYGVNVVVAGRLRASTNLTLTANGETLVRDLVLVGVAPIRGRVTLAGGAPAPSARIDVYSPTPTFGGYYTTQTDATGNYQVADVPLGPFTISAALAADRADAVGSVTTPDVPVVVDLTLVSSAIALPQTLGNGVGASWSIGKDGTLAKNTMTAGPEQAGRLEVVRSAAALPFSGPACPSGVACSGASEENQREIVVSQPDLQGLEAIRKVYVPRDGYFARQLDLIRNPGTAPVTIDLRLTSHLLGSSVVTTSSGDAAYTPADRWFTIDDASATDPYDAPFAFWPLGVTSWGEGGQAPSSVSFAAVGDGSRLLTETWSSVTIDPGATVGLLRFFAAQNDRARAAASADRLAGLPPEALVGLTPAEASAVRNFSVPPSLVSSLAPLPDNDGVVTGHLFSGDGVTPAGMQSVELRSRSPFFGARVRVRSTPDGAYQMVGKPGDPNIVVLVPRGPFDVTATASAFANLTATTSGDFPADGDGKPAATTSADVVFQGTGALDVVLTRGDGSPISSTTVRLMNDSAGPFETTDATGQARYPVVPPGPYTVRVSLAQGPEIDVPANVVANQRVTLPIVLAELGTVEGTLRSAGGLPIGGTVSITGPTFTRRVPADLATGHYRLTDVPFGAFDVVAADDSRSGATTSAPVSVGAAPVVVDLQFPPVGRVNVTVKVGAASGPPLASAPVAWRAASHGPDYVPYTITDSIGRATIPYVSGPQFRIRAQYPGGIASVGESPDTSIAEGQTVDVTVVVPGVGHVAGSVRSRDGVAQASIRLDVMASDGTTTLANGTADAAGAFDLTVPVGAFRLRAECDTFVSPFFLYGRAEVDGSVAANGATTARDALCPFGTIGATRRRDFWTFQAGAGEPVSVMLAPGVDGTTLADPYLEIYGPDGTLLAANDDRDASTRISEVLFTAPAAGEYVAVARAAHAESGAYRLGSNTSSAFVVRAFEPPRVVGVVRNDWDSTAMPGHSVRLKVGASVVESSTSAADGTFNLGVFPLGSYTLEAVDREDVAVARATGSASTPGSVVTQDLTAPARGEVTVTVRRGPLVLPGVVVTLTSDHVGALDEDRVRTRTTDSGGRIVTTPPTGSVTARAVDPLYGGTYEATGALAAGGSLSLDLVFPESVTRLFGVVSSGDGTVPLPGAMVTANGPASFQATTDVAGRYEFPAVPPGTYTLAATKSGATATQTLAVSGGERQADLHIAIPIVKGRVTEGDGITPAAARVELCQGSLCVTRDSGADGYYAFLGDLPAWIPGYVDVRVWPLDNPGLTSSGSFFYPGGVFVLTLDLALPASRAVYGVVSTAQGSPASAEVTLLHPFGGPSLTQITTADGSYRFAHAIAGYEAKVFARSIPDGLPGNGSSPLAYEDARVDITLAAGATFSGVVLDKNALPVTSGSLVYESLELVGADGYTHFTKTIAIDPQGQFTSVVPVGPFRAVHDAGTCDATVTRRLLATADGRLVPGSNPPFVLRLGEGTFYPSFLAGPLGSYGSPRFGIHDDCGPAAEASLVASAADPQPSRYGRLDASSRHATSLLSLVSGLEVRHEQFVPASGAFVRTLVWLTNSSLDPVTLGVDLRAELGRANWSLDAHSAGSGVFGPADTWALASIPAGQGSEVEDPTTPAREAGVALGQGASTASFSRGRNGDGFSPSSFTDSYAVTVPPGQRVGLLGFAVNRIEDRGTPGAVRALADLSDPEALEGLTDPDRAAILNFAVPPTGSGVATGVEGTVTRDGLASPGARVGALDVVDGFVVALTTADAAGHFVLRGLLPGDVQIVAVDATTNRPGLASASVSAGALTTTDVEVIGADAIGTVSGHVRDGSGNPIADVRLTVSHSAYASLWTAEATTAPDGSYSVAAPAGTVEVRLDRDNAQYAYVPAGGTALADFGAPPSTEVHGTVFSGGLSITDGLVSLVDGAGGVLATTGVDGEGRFQIGGVPEGDWRLVAVDRSTNRPGSRSVTAIAGTITTADVQILPPGDMGAVHGTVTGAAGAVAGARVVAVSDAFPSWFAEAQTGADGVYALSAPPGPVRATIGGDPSTERTGVLDPGGTLLLGFTVP